jgi:hypothetical protein
MTNDVNPTALNGSANGPAQPARSRGRLPYLVALCLAVPVFAGLCYALDALVDAPWAYAVYGRPTLTGAWTSEFSMPGGTHFALLLDLQRPLLINSEIQAEGDQGALITGQGSWCDDHGRHDDDIPLEGWVPVLSGSGDAASEIELSLQTTAHPQPGLQPTYFAGAWDRDTLTLSPKFVYWDGFAQVFATSSSNPDFTATLTLVLKKSDEVSFRAACARVAGKSQ